MMKSRIVPGLIAGLALAASLSVSAAETITGELLRDRGLPGGPALNTLPQGAVAHLQVNDLLGGLEGVEKILIPALPEKMLPPDAQNLLQTEHPLLTLIGYQRFQAPLNEETVAQSLGIDARAPLSLTLYFGDPRREWVLSVPLANREVLAGLLTMVLQPSEVEEVSIDNKMAVRIVPRQNEQVPEVYLVCSETTAFICGGRSMLVKLHGTPTAERLDKDTFISRALPAVDDQLATLTVNPDWLKILVPPMQQFREIGLQQLRQHRGELLQQIPPQAREQFEMQIRTQLGVRDLDEFADYVECIVVATVTQFVDWLTTQMISFEGLTVSVGLGDQAPELRFNAYSHQIQPEECVAPIPLDEVRRALAWLGSDFDHIQVTGRKPEQEANPVMSVWLQNVMRQFEAKGLKSAWFDRVQEVVEDEKAVQPVETRAPWTLTTYAVVQPPKTLEDYDTILDFLEEMPIPVSRPVKVVPGKGLGFLEECLVAETSTRNHNREVEVGFVKDTTGRDTMFEHVHRFDSANVRPDIKRFTLESAWLTRGGLFGYDQHELVNRKVFHAREFENYLVFHQGSRDAKWLSELEPAGAGEISPAIDKLLDRVPEDANCIEVCRTLHRLPDVVGWLALFEEKLHGEIDAYLEKAQTILDDSADLEQGMAKVKSIPFPLLVYSLNRDGETGKLYCLLPPNIPFPRAKAMPILQKLLADYAEKSDEVGGTLVYTRVQPETFECSVSQNTDALSTLIRTMGNSWVDTYGAGPQSGMNLWRDLGNPRDGEARVSDEVLLVNPRWAQIPGPKPKTQARASTPVPERDSATPSECLDLSSVYNASLKDSWHGTSVANNTLRNLPDGIQEFGDVWFDVRGIVQVSGLGLQAQGGIKYPKCVDGIQVDRPAVKLHILHAAGWQAPPETRIGCYKVRYANGETREIPIVYGKDVKDWWHQIDPGSAEVAWSGQSTASSDIQVALYKTTWENPLPDVKIQSIDYCSAMTDSAPFLIAITAE